MYYVCPDRQARCPVLRQHQSPFVHAGAIDLHERRRTGDRYERKTVAECGRPGAARRPQE